MAATQQMHFFDDADAILFGDTDLFGGAVPCMAGELELQVQSYEGAGDVPGYTSSEGKDSGGSSFSALAVADFPDADFIDNVSLDDLAAADHYGHTICGRQSTADSAAMGPGTTGRDAVTGVSWGAVDAPSMCAPAQPPADPQLHGKVPCSSGLQHQQQQHGGQDSSDCDMSHTLGEGESSGVGPSKGCVQGSSHSEASEDNTAGLATCRDEEQVSMPSYGLSLSRLTHRAAPHSQLSALPSYPPHQTSSSVEQQSHHRPQAEQAPLVGQHQSLQQTNMTRAFSMDSFALTGSASASVPEPPASQAAEGQHRTQVVRSYSCIPPDVLSMDFSLGCDDACAPSSFGARGRCASLNETQLRRQWLEEGELLAPRLPPSVSELELLELPEDSMPVRPSNCSLVNMQQPQQQQQPASSTLGLGAMAESSACRPMGSGGSGLMQLRGSSSAASLAPPPTVTVKRKIITSPSPLLQQPRSAKARQAAAMAASAVVGKAQSPKRVKVSSGGYSAWEEGTAGASNADGLSEWHHPSRGASSMGNGASLKTVRSMPADMNNFFDGASDVAAQPLVVPGAADAVISPNNSVASASTAHQPFARGPFFEASGAATTVRPGGMAVGLPPAPMPPVPPKAGKGRTAAVPPPTIVPGMGMAGIPCPFPAGGMIGPDGKRFGPVPSVPKPRKRASPNGNPPKAPAPNPNGHCCTQCGTQTTPVWRAGPHGPKTLCNACGVRYMKVAKGNVAPTPRRQQH